jgi:Ca2+-binding EF-hand superfamily protein
MVEQGKHLFDEMDTNNDGEVTVDELKAWLSMDHRTAGAIKRETDRRRESLQRTTAVSHMPLHKTMDASSGGIWSMKGADCKREQTYGNGKLVASGRRTSQAFGGTNTSSYTDDAELGNAERALKNREALRGKLKTVLTKCVPKTVFGELEAIPIREFARKLDQKGMKFVYQDAKGIFTEIDINKDGLISRSELALFLAADHSGSLKQYQQDRKFSLGMKAPGHTDLLSGKPITSLAKPQQRPTSATLQRDRTCMLAKPKMTKTRYIQRPQSGYKGGFSLYTTHPNTPKLDRQNKHMLNDTLSPPWCRKESWLQDHHQTTRTGGANYRPPFGPFASSTYGKEIQRYALGNTAARSDPSSYSNETKSTAAGAAANRRYGRARSPLSPVFAGLGPPAIRVRSPLYS